MTDESQPWAPSIYAITLVVSDLERSKSFYEAAFDASLVFQDVHSAVFHLGATLVNLLHRTAATELLAPSPVGASTDFPKAVFTVPVADVDAYCETLADRGIVLLNGPMTRPWGPRTASFADPDRHVWEIAT